MAERQRLLTSADTKNANATTEGKSSAHEQIKRRILIDANCSDDLTLKMQPQHGHNGGLLRDAVNFPKSDQKQQHIDVNRYQSLDSSGLRVIIDLYHCFSKFGDTNIYCGTSFDYLR